MKLGHRVRVFAPTISQEVFPELMEKIPVTELFKWLPKNLEIRDSVAMLLSAISAPRLVSQFNDFDVILAHSQPSNWLALNAKKRFGIPYISYLHQPNRFLYPRKIDKKLGYNVNPNYKLLDTLHNYRYFLEKLDYQSINEASVVLVNSNWIKHFIDEIYKKNAKICYPGIDNLFFKTDKNKKNNSNKYILSSNRHYPQKKLDYLIKSSLIVLDSYPSINYFITGAYTDYTKYLLNLTKKLKIEDKITFTNHLSEAELLHKYQNAYLYLYTSPEEDFGLGPLEAGACGVPSIVWDHAGPKETVVHGKTGLRVKPYDINALAEAQLALLNDSNKRDVMGENASLYVKKNFTWDKHISIIEKYMHDIIS
jgi:glycosyltransferase involved in cell wall biosynthesis